MRPAFLATASSRAVALVFALNGFVWANWFARIPAVKDALGLGEGALGLALLGAPVGAVAAMLGSGALVARAGAGPATVASTALLAMALPGPALASGTGALFLALALMGAASGVMDVGMNALAAAEESRLARSVMVGFHAMFSVGAAAGALAGTAGAAVAAPLPHLAIAGALAVAALLLGRRALPAADAPPPPSGGGRDAPLLALPRGPLLPIAIVAFAAMLAEGAAADWSAVYLAGPLGGSAALAGLGYAGFAAAMTAGRLAGDRLGDRFGEARLVRAGALLGGLALALALLAASKAAAVLGFACLGLGVAAIVPICFRRAATAVPGLSPGHGLAAVALLGYAGFLTGPPLIGFLAEAVGLPAALGGVALLMLVVAAASGPALKPRAGPAPAPA